MQFTQDHFAKAISYSEYRKHTEVQLNTLGEDPAYKFKDYAKLNLERIKRLEKSVELSDILKSTIQKLSTPLVLVILSEGWCGDAAQSLTVIEKIGAASNGKIDLKVFLRDSNLDIMDQYLTNGGRSIPILIGLDKETLKELFVWGPRPKASQLIMDQLKAENASMERKIEVVHAWYENDKTESIQQEINELLVPYISVN
jgi:hypothetical protein